MSNWAIRSSTDRVLEPSVGGGSIVRSIASRLEDLGATSTENQIYGCDVDPAALQETTKYCAPYKFQLSETDFLAATVSSMGGEAFDAIVANPPYTRLHEMAEEVRTSARNGIIPKKIIDKRSSLWAYFTLHAFSFIKNGGRMALLLPESILHVQYGKQILEWISKHCNRCIAISIRERCFVNDGAQARVVGVLIDDICSEKQKRTSIELIECTTATEFISMINSIEAKPNRQYPTINGHTVPYLIDNAASAIERMDKCPDLKKLKDYAVVRIGVVTGNNEFFVLNGHQKKASKLSKRHFKRIVARFSDLDPFLEFDKIDDADALDIKSWLLCANPSSIDKHLADYLSTYGEDLIKDNKTFSKRSYWAAPTLGEIPDAFLRYMGKKGTRLVLNNAGYYCTNSIHCVFFNKKVTLSLSRAICLAFYSSYCQLSSEFEGRQYGSGVLKLEPSEALELQFPMNHNLQRALNRSWSKISEAYDAHGADRVRDYVDSLVEKHCPKLVSRISLKKTKSLLDAATFRRCGKKEFSDTI